jgi:dihydrofolate reductase
MRKLIYFIMASLDGFMDRPAGDLDWVIVGEEEHRFVNDLEREAGLYLYGRRMYEIMESYWPTADTQSDVDVEREFSRIWKEIPKVVFSSTLESVAGNARLVRGDAVEEVTRLKAQEGKPIEVGGANLAGALMRAGLVDEYRIFVQPILLGAGTPMFPALQEAANLRLVETHVFQSGVVYLRYQRVE